jgi:hypothetical protein
MELELAPQPSPSELEAVRLAVTAALATSGRDASGWWRAGVDEALDHAPSAGPQPAAYAAAPGPRSTRGATRA